jgi:hypothetical protein
MSKSAATCLVGLTGTPPQQQQQACYHPQELHLPGLLVHIVCRVRKSARSML